MISIHEALRNFHVAPFAAGSLAQHPESGGGSSAVGACCVLLAADMSSDLSGEDFTPRELR